MFMYTMQCYGNIYHMMHFHCSEQVRVSIWTWPAWTWRVWGDPPAASGPSPETHKMAVKARGSNGTQQCFHSKKPGCRGSIPGFLQGMLQWTATIIYFLNLLHKIIPPPSSNVHGVTPPCLDICHLLLTYFLFRKRGNYWSREAVT